MALDPISMVTGLISKGLDKFVRDKVDEGTLKQIENDMEKHVLTEARKENSIFREFVIQYEGAAKDYKDIPWIGPIVLLFRGIIRPVITMGTFYFDWLWMTYVPQKVGQLADGTIMWAPDPWTGDRAKLLLVMNVLVLVFWFGERALKNTGLIDILKEVFVAKVGK